MLTKADVAALRRHREMGRNKVGRARKLAGLTQMQAAERTGLTQSYISRVELGRYEDLPGETMRKMARLYGCSIEDLFPAREAAMTA